MSILCIKAAFALGALEHSFSLSFACTFLEASWRRCHSSSGFSLSQFVLFLHVIPDRLDDDEFRSLCGALAAVRQKPHWIIRINDKMKVWECKLIFPTDSLQQYIRDN